MTRKEIEKYLKARVLNIKTSPYFDNKKVENLLNSKLDKTKAEILENDLYPFLPSSRKVKDHDLRKNVYMEESLKEFAIDLYKKSKTKKIIGYQLKISAPITRFTSSELPAHPGHGVSLVLNPIKKRVIYHDSCGVDMAKEIRDILSIIFDGWDIITNYDKIQFNEKNDNSCSILSLLNSYYKIQNELGTPIDKELDFTKFSSSDFTKDHRSEKFRQFLWDSLKEELINDEIKKIEAEKAKNEEKNSKMRFSMAKTKFPPEIDKDYELHLSENYQKLLSDIKVEIQKLKTNEQNQTKQIIKDNISKDNSL